ncbi:Hsp20/alpha crystallin family protein [Brumimicrobium glaciale]|uniref:Hsp20/alpha crystallin family protein n=1 Tax=Brumimicrobium glaciale TaxID=200475 RepID=A0A4Q4KJT9_9FLAO|nr:Hsp20/alpha crystallin family protein [Brumimicrobium glaciale]RYM33551.1 Hsp20/alpha crystallin family protein [Brumimicrobium glaciale]
MEMSRINSGFLPSFLTGLDEELFNKRQTAKSSQVAVNIIERDEDYVVEMAVPGFNKENIHIELDGNKLSIRGEAKESKEVEEENYTHREFSYGEFTRSFTLPKDVDGQNIGADYNEGVLRVTVPKPEMKKKVVKKIEVKGN